MPLLPFFISPCFGSNRDRGPRSTDRAALESRPRINKVADEIADHFHPIGIIARDLYAGELIFDQYHQLDGFVTAVVAGPVSMNPPEWIRPLLGIEIDAFNHGSTSEFAAISAVAVRHNAISETLSTTSKTFEPIFARKPNGDVDARPWCQGFYAAMKLRLSAWAPLTNFADINHGLLLPILLHCADDQGRPLLGPQIEQTIESNTGSPQGRKVVGSS